MSPSPKQLFHFNHCVGGVASPSLLCSNTYNLEKIIKSKIQEDWHLICIYVGFVYTF